MNNLPLTGVRVIDLSVVLAGPYSCMFLADMGAEVILVESTQHFPPQTRGIHARPTHEMLRNRGGGYPDGDPGERPWNRWAHFNVMGRNKNSMTLDITKPEGMDIFKRLVSVSDVVVENYVPQAMEKLGVTYGMLKQQKPDIIFKKVNIFTFHEGTYICNLL